jgi:inosine-uridine nucleoside N-ribohydrolase
MFKRSSSTSRSPKQCWPSSRVNAVMVSQPLIIDCDPGIDDAIAILLALASPELDLLAITTVAGNVPLANTTANGLRVLDMVGRPDLPLAAGAERPLVRVPSDDSSETHGETGLDGSNLPEASRAAAGEHAVDLIARLALERPGEITLAAVGPLTNVALLAALRPDAFAALRRIVVMGGASNGGNMSPFAEFNIWFDPEAAERVLQARQDVTLVGLDVTRQAILTSVDIDALEQLPAIGPAVAGMLRFYMRKHVDWYGEEIVYQHDSLAIAHLIDPTLLGLVHCHVEVDTGTGPARGSTLVDRLSVFGGAANALWAERVAAERFRALLLARLGDLSAQLA